MSFVRYKWSTRDADRELSRLEGGFDQRDFAAFESILYQAYVQTVQDVHVYSTSLVRSGDADVDKSSDERWESHISYGGPSTGPNNPVKYAVIEQERESVRATLRPKKNPFHTGDHNFMRRTDGIEYPMMEAVVAFFERGNSTAL